MLFGHPTPERRPMSRRRGAVSVLSALSLALGLSAMTPRPAMAGPITDLSVIRTWSLDYCSTKYWYYGEPYSSSSTACVDGLVNFGFSPSVGEYGFSYNFTSTEASPAPPAGSSLVVAVDCLAFTESAGYAGTCDWPNGPLSAGQYFSVMPRPFDANASLQFAAAIVTSVDATAPPNCTYCYSQFDYPVIQFALVTPEPSTIVLLGSGLGLIAVVSRRRRSRRLLV